MESKVIYAFHASKKERELRKKYNLIDGYLYHKLSREPPERVSERPSLPFL